MSPTDPDATPMRRFPGDCAQLGYHLQYVVDGGRAHIILKVILFRAKPKICNRYPVKAQCANSQNCRHIFCSIFQEYTDRVRGYARAEDFKKALCKRQVWVEPLSGQAKQWHEEVQFRLRGLHQVKMQGVFTAAFHPSQPFSCQPCGIADWLLPTVPDSIMMGSSGERETTHRPAGFKTYF